MTELTTIQEKISQLVLSLANQENLNIGPDTPLIGDGAVLDSMRLVELCLLLEDLASELGFTFDWTSESAMSRTRSMFRTLDALVQEFVSQQSAQT